MSSFPRLATIRQQVPSAPLADVPGTVRAELKRIALADQLRPGARIAVAAGSRGIADYPLVIKTIVAELRSYGAEPFIFPAMGSHGGATAEGQRGVLADLGITEQSMGCSIRSSMEVVQVGTTAGGLPVYCDAAAHASDGIIIVNRVKVHTDFHGTTESGLVKMMAIGLGKRQGAILIHEGGVRGLRDDIPQVAAVQVKASPILCGVAIVEDGNHRVSMIEALRAAEIHQEEPRILARSRALMAALPVENCDVLIIDRIGKEISGAGMDPNIIGRTFIDGEPEPLSPHIHVIAALRLTEATHGNACGLGFADLVSQPLLDAMDEEVTRINIATSGFPIRGRTPPSFADDRRTIEQALLMAANGNGRHDLTMMRIRDTLSLEQLWVSENLLPSLAGQAGIEVVVPPEPMQFAVNGALL